MVNFLFSFNRQKGTKKKDFLGKTFSGDLLAPGSNTVLGHVTLVVLVQRQTAELSVKDRLGLGEVITGWVDETNHGSTSILHGRVDLLNGVTEVVTIGRRVSASKDGNLLATKIQVSDLIKDLVPGGSRSTFVGSGVPGWGTNNEGAVSLQVADVDLTNVSWVSDFSTELRLDPVSSGLGVTFKNENKIRREQSRKKKR